MILNLIVKKTQDGFTAEIPSLKGCETWAPTEDEVLEKIVELARFYLKLDSGEKVELDKARDNFTQKIYKMIFHKNP